MASPSSVSPDEMARRNRSPGYLAAHIHRAIARRVDAGLRPHGLTMAQMQPLLILAYGGSTLQRDIVARSAIGQSAMVVLLSKLQGRGLIAGEPHPKDKRATLLSLTDAGRELVELATPIIYAANEDALSGFSNAESAMLSELMHRLLDNITDEHRRGAEHSPA
jgi:MarR family transcriptional regulator, transcriptional regulator for hemolysin